MIKKLFTAALAGAVSLVLTGCSLTARDLHEVTYDIEVPPTMLFLGDSIAAGYGLDGYSAGDNYTCRSYSNILKEKYEKELEDKCGHKMVNEAVSGATSADLLELVNSGKLDDILAESDAVVVSIGGNDLLHLLIELLGDLGYSLDSSSFDFKNIDLLTAASQLVTMGNQADEALDGFEENLQLIASAINERTNGVLYVQTLYNPLEYFEKLDTVVSFSDEKLGRFNKIVADHAEGQYKVVDVAAAFKGQNGEVTNIKRFDIHPNFIGHQLIADEVDKAFRETGFTYTAQEYGEEYLTGAGYAAIFGSIAAGFIALTVPAILISKMSKGKKEE